jgi:hypothetical protein
MLNWSCLLHGHEVIRYDREFSWECMRCLKKWPMAEELVHAFGVYADKCRPDHRQASIKPNVGGKLVHMIQIPTPRLQTR